MPLSYKWLLATMNYTIFRYYSIFQPDSVNAWNCNGQSRAIEYIYIYIYSTLAKVHRSSSKSHGLFFPVFIHRILLHLGLEDFPASEPVHIITPIGATFLRQRATQMKASSKRPKVESSQVHLVLLPLATPLLKSMSIPLLLLILHLLHRVMLLYRVCWTLS